MLGGASRTRSEAPSVGLPVPRAARRALLHPGKPCWGCRAAWQDPDPVLCEFCADGEREMGCQAQLAPSAARVSPAPSIFVGKFYLLNSSHIMHCVINYCFSAGRSGVSRAAQRRCCPCSPRRLRRGPGAAPSIKMTQHSAAPWAFPKRFIKKHTARASTINPGRSCLSPIARAAPNAGLSSPRGRGCSEPLHDSFIPTQAGTGAIEFPLQPRLSISRALKKPRRSAAALEEAV